MKPWYLIMCHPLCHLLLGMIVSYYLIEKNLLWTMDLNFSLEKVGRMTLDMVDFQFLFPLYMLFSFLALCMKMKWLPYSSCQFRKFMWTLFFWWMGILFFLVILYHILEYYNLQNNIPLMHIFALPAIPTNLVTGMLIFIHDTMLALKHVKAMAWFLFLDEKKFTEIWYPTWSMLFVRSYSAFVMYVYRQLKNDLLIYAETYRDLIGWWICFLLYKSF